MPTACPTVTPTLSATRHSTTRPCPAEPLAGGPSLRTISLPQEEFEKQIGGGLWRISISARAGGVASGQVYAPVSSTAEEAVRLDRASSLGGGGAGKAPAAAAAQAASRRVRSALDNAVT